MEVFRTPHGALPDILALTCLLAGYAAGVWMLTGSSWLVNAPGVLLPGHTLICAAYFIHEFAHHAIFRSAVANNRRGVAMTWITGNCHASFSALRRKHMRHHLDRADVLTLDSKALLARAPRWVPSWCSRWSGPACRQSSSSRTAP